MNKSLLCTALLVPTIGTARLAAADDAPPSGGVRVGVQLGGIELFANGKSTTAYGGDASIGYEVMRGNVGITPLLDVGFYDFTTPSAQLLFAMPGLRFALHNGPWVPSATIGVGYGYSSQSVPGGSLTDSYLALSVGAELAYQISPALALGVGVHYKPFLEPALNSLVDFGVSATFKL
jgi:Outer membrane protein beta-barrel domain